MPEMNVAASPVALVSVPATVGIGNAATASDGQAGSPFAAILKQQMDDPATIPANAIKPEFLTAANADTAIESSDASVATLLPMLIGSAELAAEIASGKVSRGGTPKTGEDTLDPAATQAELALALPGLPVATTAPAVSVTQPDETGQANGRLGRIPAALPASNGASLPPVGSGSQSDASMIRVADGSSASPPAANPPAIVAAPPGIAAGIPIKADSGVQRSIDPTPTEGRDTSIASTAPDRFMVPMHASTATAQASAGPELHVTTPIGSSHWESAIGTNLVFMSGNQQNRAELVLTPPQLGRIEISLTMNGDQANAIFISANPTVRDALENALPRLREILADAGVTLNQAQVGAESPNQSAGNRENGDNFRRGPASELAGEGSARGVAATVATQWVKAGRGLVDVFA